MIHLHGVGGEDGTIQGALEMMGISYTGSGVLASALAMDKFRTKNLWRGIGLPTANYALLDAEADFERIIEDLKHKAIVKPAHEGSSIGMSVVHTAAELKIAYENAAKFDSAVLAEQWIQGPEYTVAIIGDQVLPAIRLIPDAEFYDFHAKYQSSDTQYLCPCGLNESEEKQLQQLALDAYHSLNCEGWARVDIMRDEMHGFQLLEINTSPGMTDHSLVPMAAAQVGIEFPQLVEKILNLSLTRA